MLQASSLLCVDQHGKVHTHSQLDAPNMMTFEEEFDDKSESDESINPNDNIEYDTSYNHTFISKFGRDFVLDKEFLYKYKLVSE